MQPWTPLSFRTHTWIIRGTYRLFLDANPTVTHVYASHTAAETYATPSAYTYGNTRLTVNEILNSNPQFPTYDITNILEEEQTLVFGNQTLEIKATPGHTKGNIMLFHGASGSEFTQVACCVPFITIDSATSFLSDTPPQYLLIHPQLSSTLTPSSFPSGPPFSTLPWRATPLRP
jgi:glyoxylase-like metal-dependent hydrolase (beta-lactamase superfamily II)